LLASSDDVQGSSCLCKKAFVGNTKDAKTYRFVTYALDEAQTKESSTANPDSTTQRVHTPQILQQTMESSSRPCRGNSMLLIHSKTDCTYKTYSTIYLQRRGSDGSSHSKGSCHNSSSLDHLHAATWCICKIR